VNPSRGPGQTIGLFRTVSEIDGDFSQKSQHFVYFVPLLNGFPLELDTGAGWGQETRMAGATGLTQKFDDIFSRLDTMHQRDGWTDGRTDRHRVTAKTALMHSIAR